MGQKSGILNRVYKCFLKVFRHNSCVLFQSKNLWKFKIVTFLLIIGFPTGRERATFQDKAKNLAKGRDGAIKIRDGTGRGRAEKEVLKQENDVLKQVIFLEIFNSFCPGTSRDRGVCPRTFAPALVPGQRDTGTRIFFCPGRDNGTSRGNLNSH